MRGLRVEARPDGAAQVARYGPLRRLREVALTERAVEIRAGRDRLVIPWEQVGAVRSHGPEDADGRPRRIALDVLGVPVEDGAQRSSTREPGALLDRLTAGPAGRPGDRRTLVLPTAGLAADPAMLLAALDHYRELPAERTHLADHDWASRPTH
ncbi:hypothetical protein EV188_101945 [Actinomycetospora succinea]|uniref:Uncharacterized protein n=1 Tax=Actinomycetospora succinea TaxID=663603 RepID=A0A4R6VNV3_9PSEU|nr:hypothetical protein [Actinomycetospora succinea]TDQ65693.1 hypothetical protein EV188_101945 [Actinomycetospora succinea]